MCRRSRDAEKYIRAVYGGKYDSGEICSGSNRGFQSRDWITRFGFESALVCNGDGEVDKMIWSFAARGDNRWRKSCR